LPDRGAEQDGGDAARTDANKSRLQAVIGATANATFDVPMLPSMARHLRITKDACRVLIDLLEVYRPEGAEVWMQAAHPAFDGESAWTLIERGDVETVLAEIDRLISGAYA
jgi:hypothetical protein